MSHVDTNTINHVSLCSGYGGIDLGLKRAIGRSLRTVAFVEIEAFAAANLAAKAEAGLLDNAPIWSDLKRFPWGKFHGLVDILSGGYPCQPFSAAGKRLGAEDPRHLWPFISAGIAAMRPSVCFFENVEGHISLGLSDVIEDLGRLGYRATWCVASASECGAPHQRKRIWILAHRECEGLERFYNRNTPAESPEHVGADAWASGECDAWPSRPGEQQHAWEPPRVVGKSDELRPQGRHDAGSLQAMGISRAEPAGANGKHYRGPAESSLGRNPARTTHWLDDAELYTTCDNRTDELRLLGNGVVPAVAERAFRLLVSELAESESGREPANG
jgi:site-specific DNA-cytosine methylase